MSRFCGPITNSVNKLARQHGNQIDFVHLEVWHNYEKKELNAAADQWIAPKDGSDIREPWVFVVDRTGSVVDRFDNVATDAELQGAVQRLTT